MRIAAFVLTSVLCLISVSVMGAEGDIIQGKPVIDRLELDALESEKIHHLYFESVEMGSGQHWYGPVMVAKGAKPGKRVLLIAGVHGDELTP